MLATLRDALFDSREQRAVEGKAEGILKCLCTHLKIVLMPLSVVANKQEKHVFKVPPPPQRFLTRWKRVLCLNIWGLEMWIPQHVCRATLNSIC